MKIVFYSTNSNVFDPSSFLIDVYPSNQTAFEAFTARHPEHEFICVTQAPGMFMPEKSRLILPQEFTAMQVAQKILEIKPDLAIAMTFWVSPYDWLTVNDGLVAEYLEDAGIKTICNSVETGLVCFDKWRTRRLMEKYSLPMPKAVFVDHDLYFCAGSNKEVINNVYRQSIKTQLAKLKLPLIIKDTCGLSSYGMTVVHTYGEAVCYLNSKRNNSNRIVEEYITGQQYGLEVYGTPENYTILPPLTFSLNQYGITSPKQSAKFGPQRLEEDLKVQIMTLVKQLQIKGCAQFDLIKAPDDTWYVIEINPRLSGMSFTYATYLKLSVFDLLFDACVSHKLKINDDIEQCDKVLSLKLPIVSVLQMQKLLQIDGVKLLNQSNDLNAKQEREKGFCECIISRKSLEEIKETVLKLKEQFHDEATIVQSESILK